MPPDACPAFPLRQISTALGPISYRENGVDSAVTLVLLHGIGADSAVWEQQLAALIDGGRVLAWDAPGYGQSSPLPGALPRAEDYAERCLAWLNALGVKRCVLLGHSLGALMAAALAKRAPERIEQLILASPARGYGQATEEDRASKTQARLDMLAKLGVHGLAETRSAALLAADASAEAKAGVRAAMARLHVGGYTQAIHMLAHADISANRPVPMPVHVLVGAADAITPPKGCQAVAAQFDARYAEIPAVGHCPYIEAPESYNRWLRQIWLDRP